MRWRWLLATGLLAVVLLWALSRPSAPSGPVAEPTAPPAESAERPSQAKGAARAPSLRGAGTGETPQVEAGAAAEEGTVEVADRSRVRGTVHLADEHGQTMAKPSGTLRILVVEAEPGSEERLVTVDVVDGAWTFDPQGLFLAIPQTFRMGERYAYVGEEVDLTETSVARLGTRLLPTTRLHVLDDLTGRPLSAVRLVRPMDIDRSDGVHPGHYLAEDVLVGAGSSPVVVPAAGWADRVREFLVYAGAPGYAFERVCVDLEAGGERTVRLRPAGTLQVNLAGEVPAGDLRVRGWPHDEAGQVLAPYFDLSAGTGDAPIEALRPGAYVVRAQLGPWWDKPETLAESSCRVFERQPAETTLELRPPREAVLVEAGGELTLDPAWQIEQPTLSLEHLGAPIRGERHEGSSLPGGEFRLVPVDGRPGTWRYDIGRVPEGRYQVRLWEIGYRGEMRVPPGGSTRLRIDVGAPATIVARVRDAPDGAISEARALHWWMEPPPGVTAYGIERVTRPEGGAFFEFRVPPGRIILEVDSDRHHGESAEVDAAPGTRVEATLEVTPSGCVVIVLKDGQARIPMDPAWVQSVRAVTGEGESTASGAREDGYGIQVAEPGLYRITFGDVPGYAPIAAREVEIVAGETTRLEIPLLR